MGIPMNTHVIPMCLLGTKNENMALRPQKRKQVKKTVKNTHKYPCVPEKESGDKKQESRLREAT